MCSTWSVVCSIPNRSCRTASSSRRMPVAVLAAADEHVRRQGGEARADLPDVQVVDVGDAPWDAHRGGDLVGGEALRRRLEQDAPATRGGAASAAAEHRARDGERGDRIGPLEARRPDDDAGDRGAGEGVEIGQQVAVAALDVQVGAVRPCDLAQRQHVDERPRRRPSRRRSAPSRRAGRSGAARASTMISAPSSEQRDPVRLGREDLRPPEAERHPAGRPAAGRVGPPRRSSRARRRRQHVRGVGEERQRVGHDRRARPRRP